MTPARWYAITTQPRHEKAVVQQLHAKSIETFLPLVTTPSRWKDRRVLIDRPIFPGYVFIRMDLKDRQSALSIPSVVRMLSFGGSPAVIEDEEIESVRLCLTYGNKPEAHPFPEKGDHVRVKFGALKGLEGIVTRYKNQARIVVSIALIHKSISTEIDIDLLEPIEPCASSMLSFREA